METMDLLCIKAAGGSLRQSPVIRSIASHLPVLPNAHIQAIQSPPSSLPHEETASHSFCLIPLISQARFVPLSQHLISPFHLASLPDVVARVNVGGRWRAECKCE